MARKAFGGVTISFKGIDETAEEVFGAREISPGEMTKRLWAFIKGHGLMTTGAAGASPVAQPPQVP